MRWLLALIVQFASFAAAAQDTVHFPSFDAGDGHPPTELTGYLFKPNRSGPMPAVIFLHGCGGLISTISHRIMSREMDWAGKLNAQGYAVLMVDSFTPRGSGEECSRTGFKEWVYLSRPADAYGGLAWLQQQPFVAPDRVAEIGWSNGGGAVLFSLGKRHGRPARFTGPDFRAAIAFYPGSCSEQRMGTDWTPKVPLMILIWSTAPWRAVLRSPGRSIPRPGTTSTGRTSSARSCRPTPRATVWCRSRPRIPPRAPMRSSAYRASWRSTLRYTDRQQTNFAGGKS